MPKIKGAVLIDAKDVTYVSLHALAIAYNLHQNK